MELAFFLFFALTALAAAFSLILQKNPIYSALSLIVVIASMGGLFLLLNAAFVAVLQIVIYAGAIMTLFLFVVMMVEPAEDPNPVWQRQSKLALLVLMVIAGAAIWALSGSGFYFQPLVSDLDVKALARELFSTYLFPFEAISVLIVSSVIGALYIARKEDS